MNKRTKSYMEKAVNIVQRFPSITKAAVIGPAAEDTFAFDTNIMLAIYTAPESDISKTCVDLNRAFGENNLGHIDIYMMADEDFFAAAVGLIKYGEVIFAR